MRFWLLRIIACLGLASSSAYAGYRGDYVLCQPTPLNSLNGSYSIDFLLSLNQPGVGEALPDAWPASDTFWLHLTRILLEPAPEMQKGIQEFYTRLFQEGDFNQARVWQKTPFGLPDESVAETELTIPENCGERLGGKIQVKQAIRRSHRGDFVLYEYDAGALEKLKSTNPHQYSYTLLHSWMADYSAPLASVAALNRLLHSQAVQSWPTQQTYDYLLQLGFLKPSNEMGICERSAPVVTELQYRSKKNCGRILHDDLKQVKTLEIDWKNYSEYDFRPGDLNDLTGLQDLSIRQAGRHLLSIPQAEIRTLTSLKHLKLAGNGLNQLPSNFLSNLHQIEDLDLSGNEFVQIYRDTFRTLFVQHETGRPVRLKLSSNFEKGYEPFSHNYVYLLPGSLNGLEYLTELDFSRAHLDRIQSSVFDPLVRLENLDLSGNVIQNIDQTLRAPSLGKIQELDLSGNPFTSISDTSLNTLPHLRSLKLNQNKLKVFPSFIADMKSLQKLEICNPDWSKELIEKAKKLLNEARRDLDASVCREKY